MRLTYSWAGAQLPLHAFFTTGFRLNGKETKNYNCKNILCYGELLVCIDIVCTCLADNQRFNQTCCFRGGFSRRISVADFRGGFPVADFVADFRGGFP